MLWAAERVGFDHHGVEGWSRDCGRAGVSYLNLGDPYDTTLCAVTDECTVRFVVRAWGDLVTEDDV